VEIGWISKFDFSHLIGTKYCDQVNKHMFYYPSIPEMRNLHDESLMWKKYKSLVIDDVLNSRDCKREGNQNISDRPRNNASTFPTKLSKIERKKDKMSQELKRQESATTFHNNEIVKVMKVGKASPYFERSMIVVSSGPKRIRKPIDMLPVKGETPFDENAYWSSNPISTGMKFIPQDPSRALIRTQPEVNMSPLSSFKGHSFGFATKESELY
jgi:hypothetical protein